MVARKVKPEAVAAKRQEILDAAQRLMFQKGYEQMSLQDLLQEAGISSGAFHHYFASRGALLEAFIERIGEETNKPLLPLLQDPRRTALEKLQGFLDTLAQLALANRETVVKLGRVWYGDANAVVRQKVDAAMLQQRAPLLTEIVRQGLREGSFTTRYPEHSGEVIMALLQGMMNRHAPLMLALESAPDVSPVIDQVVSVYAAFMEAIERTLGAPPHALQRIDAQAIAAWAALIRGEAPPPEAA
jgi:AcrR family transcriptional regulator